MRCRAIAVVLVVASLDACSSGDDPGVPDPAKAATDRTAPGGESAPEDAGGTSSTLSAVLAGPAGGDPDGSGTAYVGAVEKKPEVCFDVRASKVGRLTQVALHRGQVADAGPAVAPVAIVGPPQLSPGGLGCAPADQAVVDELRSTPAAFYVEVATSEFPNGAVRGQLGGG